MRDAGMFANSGSKPPPGLGTTTPEHVAAAVVRAIESNKLEVSVAPIQQRFASHLALATPGFARGCRAAACAPAAEAATAGDDDRP